MTTNITFEIHRCDDGARAAIDEMTSWLGERRRIRYKSYGHELEVFDTEPEASTALVEFRFEQREDADDFLALVVPPGMPYRSR